MAIYKVEYVSMSARYGPDIIIANTEGEAKAKFAGGAFRGGERSLITVRKLSEREIVENLILKSAK